MEWDDLVYVLLLLISIGFGEYYRKIENSDQKKNVGTLVGLGIIICVSGFHALHIFILIFVNIAIILLGSKS